MDLRSPGQHPAGRQVSDHILRLEAVDTSNDTTTGHRYFSKHVLETPDEQVTMVSE